jgi:hypothetical protein
MPFPTWANLGPANGGTGAVTVSFPVNYSTNDIAVLFCQSDNEAVTETSGGWTQIALQGVGTAAAPGSTRLTVFWKRVTNGGGEAPAQLADAGDHVNGIIAIIRGCPVTGDPFDVVSGGTEATVDATLDLVGPSSSLAECLVLIAACHGVDTSNPNWSGQTAPNLGSLTERYDKSITIGNGGGTAIWSGTLAAAGPVGAFSAIGDAASAKAWAVMVLKPKPRILNLDPIPVSAGPWQNANPGAGGTWAQAAAGPTGIMLVAGDVSGLYMSTNRGDSWTAIGNRQGLNEQFVHAVGFDPTDPAIMYAATAHGVYRTANTGATWTLVSSDLWIGDVVPAPSDANTVYAAYHPTQLDPATGILKSTDRGLTFSVVANDLPTNLQICRLMVDPTNPAILYIVSSFHDFNHTPDDSIFRSANSGANWTRISGTLEAAGTVWDCVIDRSTPTTLWATIYTGDPYNSPFTYAGSAWKSTDSGGTWTNMVAHTGNVMVKSNDSNTVWIVDNKRTQGASEEGFWESTNGGVSFAKKSTLADYDFGWQANADRAYGAGNYGICHGFGQDLSDPNTVLQVSPQFVHVSFDAGLVFHNVYTFQVSSNYWISRRLENLTVADIRVSPARANLIYSGAFDTGLWRSLDGGLSWTSCNSPDFTGDWNGEGGNSCTILPDPADENVVWAAQGRTETTSNLVRSAAKGEGGSWVATSGIPADTFIYGLSINRKSPVGARTLFVTSGNNSTKTGDVYRSLDDGYTWALVLSGAANAAPRVTAVDAVNGNLVYAGGEGGLWKSTAGGASGTWTLLTTPADFVGTAAANSLGALRWTGVAWVEADPTIANRVYVACYGDTGTNRGLYRSDDAGLTWVKIFTGDYVRRVAVHPTASNRVFVASARTITSPAANSYLSLGIRRSWDSGASWTAINDNLPWTLAGAIAVGPGDPYDIFIGSTGNGFLKRTLSSADEQAAQGVNMSTLVSYLVDDAAAAIGDPNKQRVSLAQWLSIYNRSNRELCAKANVLRFLDFFTLEAGQTKYDFPQSMTVMNGIAVSDTPTDLTTFRWIDEMFEDEFRALTTQSYPQATLPEGYFCSSNWFYLIPAAQAQIVNGGQIDYFGLPDRITALDGALLQVDDMAQDYLLRRMVIHGMMMTHRIVEAKAQLEMWNADMEGFQEKLDDRSQDRRASLAPRRNRFAGMN